MFSHARLNQPLIGSRGDAHASELGSIDDAVFKSLAELRQANPEFPLADYALSVRRHIRLGSIVQRIVTDEGTDPAGGGACPSMQGSGAPARGRRFLRMPLCCRGRCCREPVC